ncbi:MAG TPA: sigma-70 family RNA polymerase sigma factor [Anseongella sp.]|nr:sigma-70 family RNA polymerase sigma factor [Anseongella sp.]
MFLKILAGRKKKTLSDEELAALYRRTGEMPLLGELYGRYMEMVFAICFKYLRNEEESKDAVMQIFEKLAGDLQRHEVKNFKGWLHQVSRNYCLMQLRSARHKFTENMVPLEAEEAEGVENTSSLHPDSVGSLEARLSLVEQGIGVLPQEQQQCVRLFYLEQKCYREIARITGYDLKKVKSCIQNGKRNLKIFIEAQNNEQ